MGAKGPGHKSPRARQYDCSDVGRGQLEESIALTATWGLLYLWEGNIVAGKQAYERAESMASESSQTNLAAIVRQKMYLELAKAYIRRNDMSEARVEASRGLLIKEGREGYERELASLSERLQGTFPDQDSTI